MARPGVRACGFTLLELLVVLLIIGILMGMAVLSVGSRSPEKELREELARFKVRIDLARHEALLEAREWGIRFDGRGGYRFMRLDARRQWQESEDEERLLQPYRLPELFATELRVEGMVLDKPVRPEDPPQVVLSSDGTVTPFEWDVRWLSGRFERVGYRLQAGLSGRVRIGPLEAR